MSMKDNKMKSNLKLGLQIIGILVGAMVIGTLLLVLVYKLPTQEMKNNVRRSTAIYDYEGVYPQLMEGYKMSQLDNSTDATILLNATYPKGGAINDAMYVPRVEYSDRHPVGSLTDYVNDVKEENYIIVYPRYWHGYLVVLKPLLLFFDVADIRMLNMFLLFGVITYIVCTMKAKGADKYIPWFMVALLTLNPMTIPVSFQFSTVSYIALLSSVIVLKYDFNKFNKRLLFFLIIGIVTSYFDFFTFPLVGLYFPMIFMFLGDKDWEKAMKTVIMGSIMWIIGYAGMWAGKWLVGSLLTGNNFFTDALSRASYYAADTEYTRVQIIWKNVMVLVKWPLLILAIIILLKFIKDFLVVGKVKSINWKWCIPFGVIMLAPFVWYMVAGSHSYEHYWFTYRELCVAIFAFLVGCQKIQDVTTLGGK